MDNYLIIDDIDFTLIQQNSWMVLLQKQLFRNIYLIKSYETNGQGKKYKLNLKDLGNKMRQGIHKQIKAKIEKRKNSDKLMNRIENSYASLSLRRKTEECPKKLIDTPLSRNTSNSSTVNKLVIQKQLYSYKNSRYLGCEQKNHLSFLPFESSSVIINNEINILKRNSHKLLERHQRSPKVLSQAKPILSLHELEFNRKEYFPNPNEQHNFNKKMNNIEKLLVRSSINSPTKNIDKANNPIKDRSLVPLQKKQSLQLPDITSSKVSCRKLSPFSRQIHLIHTQFQDKSVLTNKTQQTKQSQSSQNQYQLQSIIQVCMRVQRHNQKEQSFEDSHINRNGVRNYRISKAKNVVKFPLC